MVNRSSGSVRSIESPTPTSAVVVCFSPGTFIALGVNVPSASIFTTCQVVPQDPLKPYILRRYQCWESFVGFGGCSRTVKEHLPRPIIDKDTASIPAQGEHIYILWVERDRFRINMREPPIKPIKLRS